MADPSMAQRHVAKAVQSHPVPSGTGCPSCGYDLCEIIEVNRCIGISDPGEILVGRRDEQAQILAISCARCRAIIFNGQDEGRLLDANERNSSFPLPLTKKGVA